MMNFGCVKTTQTFHGMKATRPVAVAQECHALFVTRMIRRDQYLAQRSFGTETKGMFIEHTLPKKYILLTLLTLGRAEGAKSKPLASIFNYGFAFLPIAP